jgi:hypothetical protein
MARSIHRITLALTTVFLAACKSNSALCTLGGPVDGCYVSQLISVLVVPDSATIVVGQTIRLAARVTSDAVISTPYLFSWASADPTKARVDSTGIVTAEAVTTGVKVCAAASNIATSNAVGCATVIVQAVPIILLR